mgnify:CR=1 FL=1
MKKLLSFSFYDFGNSVFPMIIITTLTSSYFVNHVIGNQQTGTALWQLTIGISGILIALMMPFIGKLSDATNNFINFLNSAPFVKFLNQLTSINETLITDPYLAGGGLHELKNGGHLNVHADFNQHPKMKLDRRLNILIYLNHNWKDENGGHLELWDKEMKECKKRILPIFNRMVVFSTTDFSYHGNPNKIKTQDDNSRKSIALYYYSNGRPQTERKLGLHSTIFRKRPGTEDVDGNLEFKKIIGKLYLKSKKKI